jgi:hypothetical protein
MVVGLVELVGCFGLEIVRLYGKVYAFGKWRWHVRSGGLVENL